jgi:hypothetical protein
MQEEFRKLEDALEALKKQRNDKWGHRNGIVMKKLNLPTKQRVATKLEKVGKAEIKTDTTLRTWVDDHKKRRSTGEFTPMMNARMKQAQDFLQKLTAARPGTDPAVIKDIGRLRVHAAEKGARAFNAEKVHFPWMESRIGVNCDPDDLTPTWVHEMGHHFEHTLPGAKRRAKEFLDYRIAKSGTTNQKFRDLWPDCGYELDEIGNEDDFLAAFDRWGGWQPGKTYDVAAMSADRYARGTVQSAMYAGKYYTDGATELISMGVQLLYEDPAGFAVRDPEYFKFIVGVLDGTIR